MNSIDWALAGRISVLVIVVGWALIAAGLLDVIAEGVYESRHEEALRMDARWDVSMASINSLPAHERERLTRKAKSLGFIDEGTVA